jgi:hypothetical protein
VVDSDLDRRKLSENVLFRFTKIPFTVLFADARFAQEQIDQFENFDDENEPSHSFERDTDASNHLRDCRVGFSTSPWQRASLSAHLRNRSSDSDYDHISRMNLSDLPTEGYPAFILARKIDTDEFQTKLVLRPFNWLKTTLTYQLVATDYYTRTKPLSDLEIAPGGRVFAGNYDAHIYGINATITPVQRLYLSAGFTCSDTRTVTADNGNVSVARYRGDVWTLISSATFLASKTTDLNASYSYTRADYEQNNFADGLPLGQNFERHAATAGIRKQLTSNWTANLRYGFFRYHEIFQRNANDYIAHGIFATVMMKWR